MVQTAYPKKELLRIRSHPPKGKNKSRPPSRNNQECGLLARPARFERATFRLGEPLNICHMSSPMYRKAFIRQAFSIFRVVSGLPVFIYVVRSSQGDFSCFLDFAKKGKMNIFHLPLLLDSIGAKIHFRAELGVTHLSRIKSPKWGCRGRCSITIFRSEVRTETFRFLSLEPMPSRTESIDFNRSKSPKCACWERRQNREYCALVRFEPETTILSM